jgi:hypothetical protein
MSEIQKINSTTRISSPTMHDDDGYIDFLTKLHLVGLGLKSSSIVLNRQTLYDIQEKGKPVRTFTEEYSYIEIGKSYFDAEGNYAVSIADGEQMGVRLECTFEVHIHCPSPVDRQMVERFAKQDLRFMLLPYARSFVSDMSGRMQIRQILLPLATAAGMARPAGKKKGSDKSTAKETATKP